MSCPFKFLFFPFLLCFQACSIGTSLPEKPKEFSVLIYSSGGMTADYSQVEISKESCRVSRSFRSPNTGFQETENYSFLLDSEELQSLYNVFREQRFDKIAERKEEVFDRGGISVTLTVDGKTFNKSNGGTSFIEGKNLERFSRSTIKCTN